MKGNRKRVSNASKVSAAKEITVASKEELRAAILSGTNEEAYNFLRAIAKVNMFPGMLHTTRDEMARFYGVTEGYIQNLLARNGVTHKSMPKDVLQMAGSKIRSFAAKDGVRIRTVGGIQVFYKFSDGESMELPVSTRKVVSFYSAKVFLLVGTLISTNYQLAVGRMHNRVVGELQTSFYAERAIEGRAITAPTVAEETEVVTKTEVSEVQSVEPVTPVEVPEPSEPVVTPVAETPRIEVSADTLSLLVRTAIHETVDAIFSKFTVLQVPAN